MHKQKFNKVNRHENHFMGAESRIVLLLQFFHPYRWIRINVAPSHWLICPAQHCWKQEFDCIINLTEARTQPFCDASSQRKETEMLNMNCFPVNGNSISGKDASQNTICQTAYWILTYKGYAKSLNSSGAQDEKYEIDSDLRKKIPSWEYHHMRHYRKINNSLKMTAWV